MTVFVRGAQVARDRSRAEYEAMEREILRDHSQHRGEEIQFEFGRVYQCPKCGRVMWARPGEATYLVFKPEQRD